MTDASLRDFIARLEAAGLLRRIAAPVSPHLEMTEIGDRVLRAGGPALLFENVAGAPLPTSPRKRGEGIRGMPVLTNLFGTVERVAMGLGRRPDELRALGEQLAFLRQPEPPGGWKEAWEMLPILKTAMAMKPKTVARAPCQEVVLRGGEIDLARLPIQTCWPGDVGPLITWPLVATAGTPLLASPRKRGEVGGGQGDDHNLGIYRMQPIGRDRAIMRWLHHRGGAKHFAEWKKAHPGEPMPAAAVIGADPCTTLAAVTPVPENMGEYQFAGLLRGRKTELVDCVSIPLQVPASAEIVLEGHIHPTETAPEGPFGDHTGYYNEVEEFPVFTLSAITMREDAIYHSTYTGRPPDEPSVLGEALSELFIPLLQQQFPEVVDCWLPPEGCSYRVAVVSIRKQYPGHAKRVMMGVWSFLKQMLYTKFVIVVDDDIDARSWQDVIWAISTRMDPARDTLILENTPIDYLDFASPVSGLGGKMGLDATHKWPGETDREWGRVLGMDEGTKARVDAMWDALGL